MDKLIEIMVWKRQEIAPLVREVAMSELVGLNQSLPPVASFANALKRPDGRLAVIAEIKRRSPSAGVIAEGVTACDQAVKYRAAGASALSIITDTKFLGGELNDLQTVTDLFRQQAPAIPCLRKDFMVHTIQVLQARAAGASAILIIVRALNDDEIKDLHDAARATGLDTLFEIHNEADLKRAVAQGAQIIGVNNRDLAVFTTDLSISERLIPLMPRDVIPVSESGIFNAKDAARARAAGAKAVLVGEALMKATDTKALLNDLATA